MSYRNVFVESSARISTQNEQLVICGSSEASFPIEDLRCLVLESQQVNITGAALSKLSENGTAVIICNDKHTPCGTLLPIGSYCRQLKMITYQAKQSAPKLKRLWQQIVIQKIHNQGICLKLCDITSAASVEALGSRVLSGDTSNVEGTAAAIYFRALFGAGFTRGSDCLVNAALNYGYAILRGNIARCIASYGLEPSIGIHHKNELNNFNLADDIIEPFRPVVDLFVATNIDEEDSVLTPDIKHKLVNILNTEIISGSEYHSTGYAIERMVQSLCACYSGKKNDLIMPELIALKQHEYE